MIESMACGRPALGTPVGGIPELINDGKTGWLSGGIQVEDISQKLEALWNDRQHWAKMGNLARTNIAQHYNQKQSHLDLLELLRNDIR